MTNSNSILMTVKETSEYLRLKTTTVYHYVHHGKIGYYKVGSRVLFKKEDLDKYLERNYVPVLAA